MGKKSGAKENGEKSKEKNDAKSEDFVMSNQLTRKPLDRGTGKPKQSELYPAKALEEAKEHEEEINEQVNNDGEDEVMYEEDTYLFEIRHTEIKGVIQRKNRSSTNTPKGIVEVNPIPKHPQQEKNISLQQLYLCIFLVILIVPAYIIYFQYTSPAVHFGTPTLNINAIVSSLKIEFEKQPKMSFRIIQTALKAVNKAEPTAPAIIVLLAAKGAEKRSRHLGKKLVTAISPKYLNISGDDYRKLDYHVGKKKIDDLLHTLSENEFDAVLVEDLHLIPGSTALMFHSYCDHENAPFKRAVFVMTVASGNIIPIDSEIKFWDETANNRLMKSWSDIEEDQVVPLLARLTVGVAAITADN